MFSFFTFFIIALIIFTVLVALLIFFSASMRDKIIADVPFVPIPTNIIKQILYALHLRQGSILYDLGCGDGRVLIETIKCTPGIMGVGIENGIVPFSIAKMRTRKLPITIIYGNFFYLNIEKATHLFCYLSSTVLEKLAPKILQECKKGTRIVSCEYRFPNWRPIDTISISTSDNQLIHTLYVYVI